MRRAPYFKTLQSWLLDTGRQAVDMHSWRTALQRDWAETGKTPLVSALAH
jgi:hypothetical protein